MTKRLMPVAIRLKRPHITQPKPLSAPPAPLRNDSMAFLQWGFLDNVLIFAHRITKLVNADGVREVDRQG